MDLPQNLEGWHDSWNAMLSPWTLKQRIIQGFTGLGRNARVVCHIGAISQIPTVAPTYLWAIQSIPSLDKTMQWIWVMEPLPAKKQMRMKCLIATRSPLHKESDTCRCSQIAPKHSRTLTLQQIQATCWEVANSFWREHMYQYLSALNL